MDARAGDRLIVHHTVHYRTFMPSDIQHIESRLVLLADQAAKGLHNIEWAFQALAGVSWIIQDPTLLKSQGRFLKGVAGLALIAVLLFLYKQCSPLEKYQSATTASENR